MIMPSVRWLERIATAIAVVAALALPWVLTSDWLWARLPEEWGSRTTIIIAGDTALVLAAGIWWLWWRLPQRHVARRMLEVRDPKDRVDLEDDFRKTIGQALGGVAVLIGAGFAAFQFLQQQQTAYEQNITQQKASENSLKASRDLLVSNQVAKSFEQLASANVIMRLGGIYGLEGVMNASEQYHVAVLEALCTFVRDNTRNQSGEGPPPTDIQAALTVIGRRADESGKTDLDHANLSGADLRNGKFKSADLREAKLINTDLMDADLENADLGTREYLSRNGADLSRAKLAAANLYDAHLGLANLHGAYLGQANLVHAYLGHANLSKAYFYGADLRDAYFSDTDLSDADLNGAQNLTQAQVDQACGTPQTLPKGLKPPPKPCPAK
jgi:uncharacterized protein YjbI with pentapeptide repeats